MKNILLITFFLLSTIAKSQVVILHFNAAWNASHDVEWIKDLDDCDVEFIDIAKKPKLQKEYSIINLLNMGCILTTTLFFLTLTLT